MSMFFRSVETPPGATETSIVEGKDGQKVVKSRGFLVIMDEGLGHRDTGMLEEESGFSWTGELFRMPHVMRRAACQSKMLKRYAQQSGEYIEGHCCVRNVGRRHGEGTGKLCSGLQA